ncbi:MAG: transporter substrate-binding domain-containing protein [Gracilibacteraceae bacterium]|jgi:L-cystine transport system substrate-binding protein|nr:transporter substrate-binding domain-containing protein [Gracilibacteraceae bacterium]
MMKKKMNLLAAAALLLLALTLLAACSAAPAAPAAPAGGGSVPPAAPPAAEAEVTVIKVAYELEGTPFTFQDENGNDTGGDVEIFRLVDELLPEYTFEYFGSSDDDVVVGVTTGAYDVGLTNAFYTKERGESYLIPQENIGGNLLGLAVRNENSEVATFEQIAAQNLKVTPLIAGNGITFQFEQYNEANPNAAIPIEYSTDYAVWTKQFDWLADGKYDVVPTLQVSWEQQVVAEDGVNHTLYDKLAFNLIKPVKSYPLISKVTRDEEFTRKISEALKQVKADSRAAAIAEEFYGVNIYDYPFEEGW